MKDKESMLHIGFVTTKDLSRYFLSKVSPKLTHDDEVAYESLTHRGHKVTLVEWGMSPRAILDMGIHALVIRSPWDYSDDEETRTRFLTWLRDLEELSVPVHNPVSLMMWNLDKRYLKDLEAVGVSIVPSRVLGSDEVFTEDHMVEYYKTHGAFVLKPCVSAAAKDTFLVKSSDDAYRLQAHNVKIETPFHDWRKGRPFLLQPFIEEVCTKGEWSLTYFGGKYSHAVLKTPKPSNWLVQDELGGTTLSDSPPAAVKQLADLTCEKMLEAFHQSQSNRSSAKTNGGWAERAPLYCRVDIINATTPMIGELELVEPELFFLHRSVDGYKPNTQAAEMFCDALEAVLI